MHARPEIVFELAARVEDWPRILPHYRWVRVLEDRGAERIVEMAARRDVAPHLAIPLHWTSVQRLNRQEQTIEFLHIGGVTRGMYVRWSIESPAGSDVCLATIRHVFAPRWPVPDRLIAAIVGDYFVNGVATRTLRHIAELGEYALAAQPVRSEPA
jgi:ribosome-associated toxin RatA of RatAB toxin-antitoxin module